MVLFLRLLRLATFLSLCSPALSHFTDPTVAAFPITPVASDSRTVRLPAPSTTTCTFTYRTAPPTADTNIAKRQVQLSDIISTLTKPNQPRSDCTTLNSGWEYELCLSSGIRQQRAGEQYSLGKQRVLKDTTLVYTDGDQCATNDYKGPRETTVKFACDPAATQSRIADISEPHTCRYEMTLVTPAVCGDDRYPQHTAGLSSEDRSTEDWFMEVTSLHGHDTHTASSLDAATADDSHPVDVMCSVYSLEARARQSELNFVEWELTIDKGSSGALSAIGNASEEGDESAVQARSELVIVRHPGRRRMYDDEYEVDYEATKHTVSNSDAFSGQLAFVKLYA